MSLDEFDEVNPNEAVVAKKKMTLDRFLQQFNTLDMNNYGSWPLSVKITCWIMIMLMIGALGYFLVIRGQLDDISNAQAQEQNLLNEFREKDSKLRNLQQLQAQLQEMEANFNQQLEQLRQRGAGAAEFDRDTHGAEPGFFQPLDRFERQRARAFALDRPLGDTGEDRPKTLGERFVIGTDRQCVQRGKTGHGRASSSARISVKSGQKIWTVWCDRWRWPRF